ncbi:hypothetical protein [Terribacillus saccharophilus]|uniref:hypothetical protein n=1 Tax=Terribacillus saccharophilus TaxID=361277 RepID=UPI000BA78F75|nr:hypothetical protein [Terribacillus saccharophilus]PAF18267.1 hypothetical protein CHH51_08210 [Terribacillus saccharophilus]PAF20768.1 hypothetical protein CHH49_14635 [Terribacillus saccharophilus]
MIMMKNAAILSEEYFLSYFRLLMNTRGCTEEQAYQLTVEQIFEGDINLFGEDTKKNFKLAYKTVKGN